MSHLMLLCFSFDISIEFLRDVNDCARFECYKQAISIEFVFEI